MIHDDNSIYTDFFKQEFRNKTEYELTIKDNNFVTELINMSPPAEDNLYLLRGFANTFNKSIKPNLQYEMQEVEGEIYYSESNNRGFEIKIFVDKAKHFITILKFSEIVIPKNQLN
jgi:hypothetical protein